MSESKTEEEVIALIQGRPHWRVNIKPNEFQEERLPTLAKCWETIQACRISLRGWDYPHLDQTVRENRKNWITSWCDWMGYREYWRLYQSGQFLHLFSFMEDSQLESGPEPNKVDGAVAAKGLQPSGTLNILSALYTFTEIFEYASRLAQKQLLGEKACISVSLLAISERVLATGPTFRLGRQYMAKDGKLDREWELSVPELVAKAPEYAVKATLWFFERFGWLEAPERSFSEEQRKFLERRR